MDERGGRIALVAEQVDPEDSFRLTGLFDAHWEALEGQDHGDGPKGVSVDEAIAWARHHARYVSVRVGSDTHYSAGELDLAELDDNDPDPRWPAGGMIVRARPVGTPPDGSVQEVDWLIEANATGVPAGGPEEFARLRNILEEGGRLRDLELTRSRNGATVLRAFRAAGTSSDVRMRCIVRAGGSVPPVLETDRIFEDALANAFPGQHGAGAPNVSTWCLGPRRRAAG
jgi:hypothetical protein